MSFGSPSLLTTRALLRVAPPGKPRGQVGSRKRCPCRILTAAATSDEFRRPVSHFERDDVAEILDYYFSAPPRPQSPNMSEWSWRRDGDRAPCLGICPSGRAVPLSLLRERLGIPRLRSPRDPSLPYGQSSHLPCGKSPQCNEPKLSEPPLPPWASPQPGVPSIRADSPCGSTRSTHFAPETPKKPPHPPGREGRAPRESWRNEGRYPHPHGQGIEIPPGIHGAVLPGD